MMGKFPCNPQKSKSKPPRCGHRLIDYGELGEREREQLRVAIVYFESIEGKKDVDYKFKIKCTLGLWPSTLTKSSVSKLA